MPAKWKIKMTPNVRNGLVNIEAVRTEGQIERAYYERGVPSGNITDGFKAKIAAQLKAKHDRIVSEEAEGQQLTGWASDLEAKLNAMES